MFRSTAAVWALFIGSAAVNLIVVFWPAPPGGAAQLFPEADKVTHFLVFAAVVWTGSRTPIPLVPLAVVLAVHAIESELVQHLLLPARSGDVRDALADLVGVAAGMLPAAFAAAKRKTT